MRISDWSSDVCSSDLGRKDAVTDQTPGDEVEASRMPLMEHMRELRTSLIYSIAGILVAFFICYYFSAHIYEILMQDRKRVVSGKRVSVRVDLGGRRMIKKKHESLKTEIEKRQI